MILILERELTILAGHHHTQISAIQRLLPGQEVTVLTTRAFGLDARFADYKILPLLPPRAGGIRAEIEGRLGFQAPLIHEVARILKQTVRDLGMGADDRLVVPSCRAGYLRALLKLYGDAAAASLPPARVRILSEDVVSALPPQDRRLLLSIEEAGHLRIFTETRELADHLTSVYGLPCDDKFLLPVSIPAGLDPPALKSPDDSAFRIVSLGQQRRGKGSFDIPNILEALRRSAAYQMPRAKMTIQAQGPRKPGWRHRRFLKAVQRTAQINPNVVLELLPSDLPPETFARYLNGAHVALLPYWVSRYGKRGSGMVTDSVLARKPVVYTQGLSMAAYLNLGNAEAATGPKQFAEALLAIRQDWQRYRDSAEFAGELMEDHIKKTRATILD